VLVAQTLRIDVALEVGAATDEVTVNADAPLLRTESSDVSYVIKAPEELPIFGVGGNLSGSAGIRNPYAMVQMIPGSTWTPNSLVRLNGTPANTQSWRVEGQDASNSGTPGVPAQSQPSVDAIQEVAIQTSNFAAEYGQAGGGVFNVTMKSGTNQFHGTAYEYLVNEAFNSGNPFTDIGTNPGPRARRNDYGFTFGGPIRRDKTFFFVSFEQFRETTVVNNAYQTVPTQAYRNGDFRTAITSRIIGNDPLGRQMLEGMIYDPATTRAAADGCLFRDPFPNNTIRNDRWDPVAVKIQSLFPQPSGPTANGLTQNYLNPFTFSRHTEVPSVKIDQLVGKGRLSFFWQRTNTGSGPSQLQRDYPGTLEIIRSGHQQRCRSDPAVVPDGFTRRDGPRVQAAISWFSARPGTGSGAAAVPTVCRATHRVQSLSRCDSCLLEPDGQDLNNCKPACPTALRLRVLDECWPAGTFFGNTANLAPRQGLLVARITF